MLESLLTRINQRVRTDDEGFTLIELLVVITILGILAAVVVFSVAGVNDKGQDSACKTDTATLRTAQEAYYAKNSKYADSAATLKSANLLSTLPTLHSTGLDGSSYKINTLVSACTDVPAA